VLRATVGISRRRVKARRYEASLTEHGGAGMAAERSIGGEPVTRARHEALAMHEPREAPAAAPKVPVLFPADFR
jgi:hypothetical protein